MRKNENLECIALVGSPNSGKTTLYNWLTASKFKTVNYPGATVEYSVGGLAERYAPHIQCAGVEFLLMDTPGTYSLFPKSADEAVTHQALYDHPDHGVVKKVILVIDATQLERHLLLAYQMRESGFNFVIALTMSDLLQKNKIQLEIAQLKQAFGCEVILIDGVLGGGIPQLVEKICSLPTYEIPKKIAPWSQQKMNQVQKEIAQLVEKVEGVAGKKSLQKVYEATLKIDRWLLHPIWGLGIFFLMMWGLFTLIYWGAAPLMDIVDGGFSALKEKVVSQGAGSLLFDFLGNGVVGSFGAVLVFVPQIFILFFGIGVLESSGYLARAATLIDKPFSKIGLSGRSFVPLLSGFACAVPAIIATRNMSSAKDRWITNFIIPLMTCSARLPVYALLLGFLFKDEPSWKAGMALAGLYICAILIGSLAAGILNRMIQFKDKSFFMMELPLYRRPKLQVIFQQAFSRTWSYVKRAGPPIFIFAVLIWLGSTFPNFQKEDPERLQSSYLAQVGQAVEPLFRPMGVDWRVGVGLISAFAAREVFVSSMAIMFNISSEQEEDLQDSLLMTMKNATFSDGTLIFTFASVTGLLFFFMIALQCMSTVGVQLRENASWKFAVVQLLVFNVVAYGVSVGIVHGLRWIGIA